MVAVHIVCPHCGAAFDAPYDPDHTKTVVVECVGCRTSLSIINYLPAEMNREWYRRQREMRGRKQGLPSKVKLGLPTRGPHVMPEEGGAREDRPFERRPINQPKPLQMVSQEAKSGIMASPMPYERNEVIVEDNPPPTPSVQPAAPLPPSMSVTGPVEAVAGSALFNGVQLTTALVPGEAGAPYVPTAFADGKIVNPKPLLTGDFGPFRIEAEISRGGMGAVYRAIDTRATDDLQRCVALKVLLSGPAATPEETSRFKREALAHGKLSHPNLVMVYDAGEIDGRQYIAMELIQGQSLDKLIRVRPMTIHETLEMMRAVCDAMGSAHEQGIIHRDIKPANILIDQMNSPKITDFGLARNLEEITRTTRSGMVMGTPAYMSPEQAEGRSDIGPETDVWSMGTVMYEMLTGKPPFYGDTAIRLALRITQDEPRSPRHLNPEIPAEVEAIVLKCLRKDPAGRYPTAGALGADIANFLEGRPVRAAFGSRRAPSKATQFALVGATVVLMGLVGAWGLSMAFTHRAHAGNDVQAGVDYRQIFDQAKACLEKSQYDQAAKLFKDASQGLHDGMSEFYLGRIAGLQAINAAHRQVIDSKKLETAKLWFAESIRLNPDRKEDCWLLQGAIEYNGGRDEDAVKDFREALQAAPKDANASLELALVLVQTAKARNDGHAAIEARDLCRNALKLDPNCTKAKELLAKLK